MKTRKCKGGNKYYCLDGSKPYTSWVPPFKKKCKEIDALLKPVQKFSSIDLGKQQIKKLLAIVFISKSLSELSNTMQEIYEIALGNRISEVIVYEDSRYLLTTRELQKIKEVHYGQPTWNAVKKYYEMLFLDLFNDLNPKNGVISNGSMENKYKLVKHVT